MALLLAGLSSVFYGLADFAGGFVTRRERVFAVVTYSQIIGLAALMAALLLLPEAMVSPPDVLFGAAAGLAGGTALLMFYQGLATGRVVVVAPVSALMAAVVPLGVGLALGERPSLLASLGVAAALPAIWFVSSGQREEHGGPTQAWMGLVSGVGFGLFFVFIAQTAETAGLWPLVPARMLSIGLAGAVGVATGSMAVRRSNLALIAGAGGLDMASNIAFLLASRTELLILVAVITSLYPVTTVLLARTILGERLRGRQPFGLALAAVGVVLMALG